MTATLDFGPVPPRLTALELEVTGPPRYLLPVTVQGSQDQQAWIDLPVLDYIYDLAAQGAGRSGRLRLQNPVQLRYLRLSIPDADAVPLRLSAGRGTAQAGTAAPQPLTEVFRGSPAPSAVGRRSLYTLDLGGRRPVGELTVSVARQNYSRPATVEGSVDGQQWRPLGGGLLYDYDVQGRRGANPPLPLSECACRYVRLAVEDGDEAPLPVTAVTLRALPVRLLFAAETGGRYWVYSGAAPAGRPVYDLSRLPVDREAAPMAAMGAVEPNPAFRDSRPLAERYPWLLWGGIGLAVAVVGYAVLYMARRLLREGGGAGA